MFICGSISHHLRHSSYRNLHRDEPNVWQMFINCKYLCWHFYGMIKPYMGDYYTVFMDDLNYLWIEKLNITLQLVKCNVICPYITFWNGRLCRRF